MKNEVDTTGQNAEKPRTVEDGVDRAKPWQLSEIVVADVLALGSNGIQKLWKWARSEKNLNGKLMIILLLSLLFYMLVISFPLSIENKIMKIL